ncbi:MAG: aminopeptidase [Planctomycetaceae bacterium]|nr:MAG: aminopeptidase [Planctomycetaceae bacterium]
MTLRTSWLRASLQWICILSGALLLEMRGGSFTTLADESPPDKGQAPSPRLTSSASGEVIRDSSSSSTIYSVAEHWNSQRPVVPSTVVRRGSLDLSPTAIEERLRRDAAYLASDELEGRGVRTRGLLLAAEYIAHEFAQAGLDISHYNGTPYQEFRLHPEGERGTVYELALQLADGQTLHLDPQTDFRTLMTGPRGRQELPVVFVGYGITEAEWNYDDFEGIDVQGKAVIILRHEPVRKIAPTRPRRPILESNEQAPTEKTDRLSDPLLERPSAASNKPHRRTLVITKIKNAIQHGAAAVLLVTDQREYARQRSSITSADRSEAASTEPVSAEDALANAVTTLPEPLIDVQFNLGLGSQSIPVVHLRRELLDRCFLSSVHKSLEDLEKKIEDTGKPQSFELPGTLFHARVVPSQHSWLLCNVVGILPGKGKFEQETIVVGAHYDHLGRGGWGSLAQKDSTAIHNGADDNASGTSVLLEVARQMAASNKPRPRRIIFIAFSAEELGLIGSRRYVQNPLVPLNQTIAMLNLDMVGRLRNDRLTVYGTGTAAEWPTWLTAAATPHRLLLIPRPSGFGPSDHASFYDRGIPVLHFFTGFHPEYHRPSDDVELLNIEGMRRITAMLVDLLTQIIEAENRPRITSVDEAAILASLGEYGLSLTRQREMGARLGVVLDSTPSPRGIRVQQVLKFSPAERAGIRAGDVIVTVNESRVESVEALQDLINKVPRGETVKIIFERGETLREVEVLL